MSGVGDSGVGHRETYDPAGCDGDIGGLRRHDAAHPPDDAGDAARGLHPDRAREGRAGARRARQARGAQRACCPSSPTSSSGCPSPQRRHHHRDDLLVAGYGLDAAHRRPTPRTFPW